MPSYLSWDSDALIVTREQARALGQKILRLASADTVTIDLTHTVRRVVRIANSRIMAGNDGVDLSLRIMTRFGRQIPVSISLNQIDDTALRAAITQAEALAREQSGSPVDLLPILEGPRSYAVVNNWHASTAAAIRDRPPDINALIEPVTAAGLTAAGFIGLAGSATYGLNRDGREAYYRDTDCECTVGARTPDGTASGWNGAAHRDWAQLHPDAVARVAVDVAKRSVGARALEPGRRTAIFSSIAVVQLVRYMTTAYDAYYTDLGYTPFSGPGHTNKLGKRVFDPRISISTDPADLDGGCAPFFWGGYPLPKMTWVENGTLVNLAYDPFYAARKGKSPASDVPWSFRMSGGPTSLEHMIASCQEGIFVNRISSVQVLDPRNGMITGVTRDGCFFVKNGKIDRPVKNFRFTDSPWFFLNNLEAIGMPVRAAFGYSPPQSPVSDPNENWPRRPIIVPPLMVRDFNFTALSDAI